MAADKPNKDAPGKGKGGGNAPGLEIGGLGRGLKLLLLWGLPALGLVLWCLYRWDGGPVARRTLDTTTWLLVGKALGGAGLIACAWWLFLPLGHWLRLYPIAKFVGGSKALWFLPMFLAFPLWLACYLAIPAATAFGGWSCWLALEGLGLRSLVNGLVG